MHWNRNAVFLLAVLAVGCGSADGVIGGASPEEAALVEEKSEIHYFASQEQLVNGVAEFKATRPFKSFSTQMTAAETTLLEYQVLGEDGNWSTWKALDPEWKDGDQRNGHTVLASKATQLRIRTKGELEYARIEMHDGDAPAFDDEGTSAQGLESGVGTVSQEISRPGAWAPAPAAHAAGQRQNVPYEGGPRACSGTFLAGTRALGDFLKRTFAGARSYGGYACRPNTANPSQLSVHASGRALDLFVPLYGGQADNDLGDPIANWLISNANTIGITLVIWDRSIWQANLGGNKLRAYGGPHPHHDHLHIELSTPAARRETAFFRSGMPLPAAGCSVGGDIAKKYNALGAGRSVLGNCTTSELGTPDGVGRYNHFEKGSIYWTPKLGAHEVHGQIRIKWESSGWERGPLGYPITDETATPDGRGRYNHFERGSIYWTEKTGAQIIYGEIKNRWAAMDFERSRLGYPITSEASTPDNVGRYNHFEGGSIYWTQATGAWALVGAFNNFYRTHDFERGPLGYPTANEQLLSDGAGVKQTFQRGTLYWSNATGAQALFGAFLKKFEESGAEKAGLYYPTKPEQKAPTTGTPYVEFQNGGIFATAQGTFLVKGDIYRKYMGESLQAQLGNPISDETAIPGGAKTEFEKGTLTWDAFTTQVTVTLKAGN